MKKIISLCACLLAITCVCAQQVEQKSGEKTIVPLDEYPYSEIGTVYDTVLDVMMPGYLESIEADGKSYASELKKFIDETMPKSKFVDIMTDSKETKKVFERARTDPAFRDTEEFKNCFEVTVSVSVQMAQIIFPGRFDVFHSKHVYPTEISEKLFRMVDNEDTEEYVSWVYGEVPAEKVKEELGDAVEVQPGDIFYGFNSPQWYWQKLAGRQGYLQVRGEKIIEAHITMLN